MTSKALLDEIMRLPVAERLKLLEDAWDSIAASPTAVPVPAWHEAELDRRLHRPSAEPSQARTKSARTSEVIRGIAQRAGSPPLARWFACSRL
jgi:putative addiction module component (TIGR02574 family)